MLDVLDEDVLCLFVRQPCSGLWDKEEKGRERGGIGQKSKRFFVIFCSPSLPFNYELI